MPEKVLVVDDEHDIADLLEVYLQNENYIVYKFYSAREALDCIENQEVDLHCINSVFVIFGIVDMDYSV